MLVRKGDDFFIFDSDVKAAALRIPRRLPRRRSIFRTGHSRPSRARSSAASFSTRGGSSATTSTIATCTAWTGRRCAIAICRWSIACQIATS